MPIDLKYMEMPRGQLLVALSEKESEITKLRMGLDMIRRCAGAPDPVGALRTVIEIADKALGSPAAKEECEHDFGGIDGGRCKHCHKSLRDLMDERNHEADA